MILKGIRTRFRKIEDWIGISLLLLLALLLVLEAGARFFKMGIPYSDDYVRHLVLWLTFIGGMFTSREKRHLALTAAKSLFKDHHRKFVTVFTSLVAAAISVGFAFSALENSLNAFGTEMVGFIPKIWVVMIMPIGFLVMGVRFITTLDQPLPLKLLAASGLLFGIFISFPSINNIFYALGVQDTGFLNNLADVAYWFGNHFITPLFILLVISALLGAPIFVVLGGIAYFMFMSTGDVLSIVSYAAYNILTEEHFPALPLFTFAGFILSESKAGERLVKLFNALFGWLPGGMAIMAVLVCTFFTTFTGASGVTILALGGLLAFVMEKSGKYSEAYTNGLLTASGSIGLLFPPSLPIILYGVVAHIPITDMFLAGILPGVVMVLILSSTGIISSFKNKVKTVPFKLADALKGIKESIWELLLPVLILLLYFNGITRLVETGGIAVLYALVVEVFIKKDLKIGDIPRIITKALPIIGGVLIILAVSNGLKEFIVDQQVPMLLKSWVAAHIQNKYLFLILLNIALLITGCLMDIFSAIMVVVPLILPLASIYDIHPVHLGIIFLANLELGYLTPPVGLNLFLASYRFEKPLDQIYKNVVPFFLILLVAVLLITYVPWISTGFLDLLGK